MLNCIDVCSYDGDINWSKVKAAGVKYVILRSVVKGLGTDVKFESYLKGARDVGLQIGVYVYSYAASVSYANKEADALIKLLRNHSLELGVWYDVESNESHSLSSSTLHSICDAFRAKIEASGYKFGIYTGRSFYTDKFTKYDASVPFWIAVYGKNDGKQYDKPSINHHLAAHQFTDVGKINGIGSNVDCNEWYGFKMEVKKMTTRNDVIKLSNSLIGFTGGTDHKKVLNWYNSKAGTSFGVSTPYCMMTAQYTWNNSGITGIPLTASCGDLINKLKKLGYGWIENDAYIPQPGDGIIYAWDDSGIGDNTDGHDHIGIVTAVANDKKSFTVHEGNAKTTSGNYGFKDRVMSVNGRYIRGFVDISKWVSDKTSSTVAATAPKTGKLAVDGYWGKNTTKKFQKVMGTVQDGIISGQPKDNKKYLSGVETDSWEFVSKADSSNAIKAWQTKLKQKGYYTSSIDGICGKNTVIATQKFLKAQGLYTGAIDGSMGVNTVKAMQNWLNKQ